MHKVLTTRKMKGIAGSLVAIALLLSVNLFSVHAVNNCTLAALTTIVGTGGTLDFACATDTTITLTAELTITNDLTLTNTGAGKVTISGDTKYRIFYVNSNKTLSLTNLNLTNGNGAGTGPGGAIYNNGTLTLTNSSLYSNNSTFGGGAIYNNNGTLSITNSSLYSNTSSGIGGAIYSGGSSSTLTITDSTLSNNSANNSGGAIVNDGGGEFWLTNSSLYNNSVGTSGGAIFNNTSSTITITNSSLYGNSANNSGGAIINYGNVSLINATFVDNTGTGNGRTIYNSGGTFDIKNSLLQGSNICNSSIIDGGYNLEVAGTSCGFSNNNVVTTNAKLGAPGNNGGPTPTIALLEGSPAIDAIPLSACNAAFGMRPPVNGLLSALPNGNSVYTDQRRVSRPQGAACDIGAFEFAGAHPADLIPQLRVSPDRVVANNLENLISFSFKVKNIGIGSAGNIVITIPVLQGLDVGYLEGASAGVWVTQVTASSVTIALPTIEKDSEAHGTLVFRPNANAVVGTQIEVRYALTYNDEVNGGKALNSNSQRFVFGEVESNRDESKGAVQPGAAVSANVGEKVSIVQTGYLADELVSQWYTAPDGNSVSLGVQRANAKGEVTIVVDTAGLSGDYAIVGYGNRSEVTEVNILTVV
ncbi:hypothetical protein OZ401_004417 [Candidatus Chlorohelix allophototropha]|nr:hypothetical protein OZ401_004417 [Chloroflexota bacterium L227-S17]